MKNGKETGKKICYIFVNVKTNLPEVRVPILW